MILLALGPSLAVATEQLYIHDVKRTSLAVLTELPMAYPYIIAFMLLLVKLPLGLSLCIVDDLTLFFLAPALSPDKASHYDQDKGSEAS
jgi:hypothetical protein